MIRNLLITALRNLRKHRLFTALNIGGLSLGLAGFILIAAYIQDELSYDRFHTHVDRIVRINTHIRIGDSRLNMAYTSDVIGPALLAEAPEVEAFARIYNSSGSKLIKRGDRWYNEPRVANADSSFFRVFTFEVLQGDPDRALTAPNSVVLTRSAAERYFNTVDAVGRTLQTNDRGNTAYQVTAVIDDMPKNSHFHFDFLFSMENANYTDWNNPLGHNFTTYLLLRRPEDRAAMPQRLEAYIQKYCLPAAQQHMEIASMEEFRRLGNVFEYAVIPVKDIHLHANLTGELDANGNIQYVYIFGAVSLFILLIACVNFMNLSTARSANRAKDVGIRKVLGASRAGVAGQFLAESLLLSVTGTLVAVVIAILAIPLFNELSGKSFTPGDLVNFRTVPWFAVLAVLVGLLAGYYPAVHLSAFAPVRVLKSRSIIGTGKSPFRSGLVVFQFAISIVLMVGTFIVTAQLHYIQRKNLGYERENIILVDDYYALGSRGKAFREEVLNLPGVVDGTLSGYIPIANTSRSDNTFATEAVISTTNSISMQNWYVDDRYLPTFGLELIAGRNFSPARPADSSAVIINETAARLFGFGDQAVGRRIYTSLDGGHSFEVIGVVRDFHFESLRNPVTPLGFFLDYHPIRGAFKVATSDIPAVLAGMEAHWRQMVPDVPFSYRFLDEAFDRMYRSEQRIGELSQVFAIMSIAIACLGLFGLAAFMAEQRSKEIGIRKVLGASSTRLVGLLSLDFLKLVFIAIVIALPVAWWAMNRWLEDFAYRVDLEWWMFAAAGMTAVVIALLTVNGQAIRAAIANPVDSLREE